MPDTHQPGDYYYDVASQQCTCGHAFQFHAYYGKRCSCCECEEFENGEEVTRRLA